MLIEIDPRAVPLGAVLRLTWSVALIDNHWIVMTVTFSIIFLIHFQDTLSHLVSRELFGKTIT